MSEREYSRRQQDPLAKLALSGLNQRADAINKDSANKGLEHARKYYATRILTNAHDTVGDLTLPTYFGREGYGTPTTPTVVRKMLDSVPGIDVSQFIQHPLVVVDDDRQQRDMVRHIFELLLSTVTNEQALERIKEIPVLIFLI